MGPVELGRALEERGFGSLWAPSIRQPLSRRTPFPGGDLPKKYYDVMDPFVTLWRRPPPPAAPGATAVSGRAARFDPDRKQVATSIRSPAADSFRRRRRLERRGDGDHGHRLQVRSRVMPERVEAMRAIWTSRSRSTTASSSSSAHDDVAKPVQKRTPVHRSAAPPARRPPRHPFGTLGAARAPPQYATCSPPAAVSQARRRGGRTPATLPVTIFGMPEDRDLLERYGDAGVARVVFNLPPAKADEVLPLLDRCAALARQVCG